MSTHSIATDEATYARDVIESTTKYMSSHFETMLNDKMHFSKPIVKDVIVMLEEEKRHHRSLVELDYSINLIGKIMYTSSIEIDDKIVEEVTQKIFFDREESDVYSLILQAYLEARGVNLIRVSIEQLDESAENFGQDITQEGKKSRSGTVFSIFGFLIFTSLGFLIFTSLIAGYVVHNRKFKDDIDDLIIDGKADNGSLGRYKVAPTIKPFQRMSENLVREEKPKKDVNEVKEGVDILNTSGSCSSTSSEDCYVAHGCNLTASRVRSGMFERNSCFNKALDMCEEVKIRDGSLGAIKQIGTSIWKSGKEKPWAQKIEKDINIIKPEEIKEYSDCRDALSSFLSTEDDLFANLGVCCGSNENKVESQEEDEVGLQSVEDISSQTRIVNGLDAYDATPIIDDLPSNKSVLPSKKEGLGLQKDDVQTVREDDVKHITSSEEEAEFEKIWESNETPILNERDAENNWNNGSLDQCTKLSSNSVELGEKQDDFKTIIPGRFLEVVPNSSIEQEEDDMCSQTTELVTNVSRVK